MPDLASAKDLVRIWSQSHAIARFYARMVLLCSDYQEPTMRNLIGVCISISLGLSWGCGGDSGTGGTNTGGTSKQPTAAGSGSTATSTGAGKAGAAVKGAAGTAATTGTSTSGATTSGAKAGSGAPATT